MKRIIQGARADELRAKREAYLAEKAALDAKKDEENTEYYKAQSGVFAEVEARVWDVLGTDTGLPLEIEARSAFSFRDEPGVEIHVECGSNPHKVPLCWHWQVTLDKDGAPKKESGSWSGMDAVSAEDIEFLRNSVDVLEKLNNADWATILSAQLPKWADYHTTGDYQFQNPEVKQSEIDAAVLSEGIGENVLFATDRKYSWVKIIRETPTKFVIAVIPDYDVAKTEGATDSADSLATLVEHYSEHYSYQKSKDKVLEMLAKPYVTKKY